MTENLPMQTPLSMFYHWESVKGDAIYLRQPINHDWQQYSWRDVGQQSRSIASALQSFGLDKNERVCILSDNCAHWVMADLAIMMSGLASAPAFTTMTADNVLYILKHSNSKVLFVGKTANWQQLSSVIPDDVKIISFPGIDIEQADYSWDELLNTYAALSGDPQPGHDEELTTIYTSGSTGEPKGVSYNFKAAGHIASALGKTFRIHEADRMISYLPMAHGFERAAVSFISMYGGCSIGFNESIETFASDITTIRPTVFQCVPRLWTKFQQGVLAKFGGQDVLDAKLADPEHAQATKTAIQKALGLDDARILLTGSAPTPMPLHSWYDALDMPLCEVYGQSEILSGTCNLPWDRKPGTLGKPTVDTEIKIAENGEVLIKADAVMTGYLNEPQKTAQTLIHGWVYTGDKGEIDQDGFLKITGRVKEIFKTAKGKFVAPVPIEGRFVTNTDIEQVCLMGSGMPQTVLLVDLTPQAKTQSRDLIQARLKQQVLTVNNEIESHAKIASVIIVADSFSIQNGMLTHTMKLKRSAIEDTYSELAEDMFNHSDTVKDPLVYWCQYL